MLLSRFQRYCTEHNLYRGDSKWLLAVSGGIDSMVLAHLCLSSKFNFAIAHCNFGLRGNESNGDEDFVKTWAQNHNIPFFVNRFDTKNYATEQGISTQMAARDLRYAWFKELCETKNYSQLAVAHHADDNAETLLINLSRGTGLKGLCGMQAISGQIVRPLLFATRQEIVEYANENNIAYREDSTNATTDYARNRIRHEVIPSLQKINSSVTDSILQTACHITQAYRMIADERERIAEKVYTTIGNETHISITALKEIPHYDFWLYELLQAFNFSGAIVGDILKALEGQAGKCFRSDTHELTKDRTTLIIVPYLLSKNIEKIVIEKNCETISTPIKLQFSYLKNDNNFVLQKSKNIACLDCEKLQFPLVVRLWKNGDSFIPLGMKGVKKVSDFLIDEKIPLHKKSRQYVLVSEENIVWVVGQRIDERYKITEKTTEILIINEQNVSE